MRGYILVLLMLVAGASVAAGADRAWELRAGGGPAMSGLADAEQLGRVFALEAAKPVRPWLTLGLEGTWVHVDGSSSSGWNSYTRVEPWNAAIVTARFRLQPLARTGLVPFLEASNGVSLPWGGGSEYRYYVSPTGWYSIDHAEASSLQWVSSVGVGLRIWLPRTWPDPEVGIRRYLWDGGYVSHVVEPRLALSW